MNLLQEIRNNTTIAIKDRDKERRLAEQKYQLLHNRKVAESKNHAKVVVLSKVVVAIRVASERGEKECTYEMRSRGSNWDPIYDGVIADEIVALLRLEGFDVRRNLGAPRIIHIYW